MGSTHQNIKQLALKLQKNGFLYIEKDKQDLRAVRLKLTEKSYAYWEKTEERFRNLLSELFEDLCIDEINTLLYCLNKLSNSILTKEL